MRERRGKSEARVQRWNSTLLMSRGKRFESARRLSVLFALALRHRGLSASSTAFAEVTEPEHDDLASMHNCIRLEGLTFRAVLSEGSERLDLVRV
jgi:hypothetical protein